MTDANKDFEWSRRRLKDAKKRPTPYNQSRTEFLLNQARQKNGERAVQELKKEFKLGN
jgi:hypothetical protein